MRAKQLSVSSYDILALAQLYPCGCTAEEAADFLRVSVGVVGSWTAHGRRVRSGVCWKLAQLIGGTGYWEDDDTQRLHGFFGEEEE